MGGRTISPAVAGIIIAIVVIVVGFFIWRGTSGSNRGMDASQQDKMRQMMIEKGFGKPGERQPDLNTGGSARSNYKPPPPGAETSMPGG